MSLRCVSPDDVYSEEGDTAGPDGAGRGGKGQKTTRDARPSHIHTGSDPRYETPELVRETDTLGPSDVAFTLYVQPIFSWACSQQ